MAHTYVDPYDCNFADPLPFDYSLLNFLYVHKDGNIEIDFAGDADFRRTMNAELISTPRSDKSTTEDVVADNAPTSLSFKEHWMGTQMPGSNDARHVSHGRQDDTSRLNNSMSGGPVRRNISHLVGSTDYKGHLWIITQPDENHAPYAHMFHTPAALFRYIEDNGLPLPSKQHSSLTATSPSSPVTRTDYNIQNTAIVEGNAKQSSVTGDNDNDKSINKVFYSSSTQHAHMPLTNWIDIQTDAHDASSGALIREVLGKFPLRQSTIDRCVCMGMQDSIDTDNLSNDYRSYIFINLMCTPLENSVHAQENDAARSCIGKRKSDGRKMKNEPVDRHGGAPFGEAVAENSMASKVNPFIAKTGEGNMDGEAVRRSTHYGQVRSVMQMRFDAARARVPRSAVPEPVPVCVLIFSDWVITIHEKPFAELRNLFNVIKFHCSPDGASSAWRRRCFLPMPSAFTNVKNRFTSSFLFVCLFQIAVGHHVDNITLARASDELGDIALNVNVHDKKAKHDDVLHYITALRRCFSECGADINRRESIIAHLLQPHMAHNFLLNDAVTRRLLENAQDHLHYVKHELDDCRDSVALSSWSHNIAVNWIMLQQNNRALRILVLLSEMTNIMCPVTIVHSLYSMNIMLPYTPDSIVPCDTMTPFWVVGAIVLFLISCCMPSLIGLLYVKKNKTKLIV